MVAHCPSCGSGAQESARFWASYGTSWRERDVDPAVSLLQRSVSIADEFGVRGSAVQFRIQRARCLHTGAVDA